MWWTARIAVGSWTRQAVSSDIGEGRKGSKRAVSLLLYALQIQEFQMCLDLFYTQMPLSSVGFTQLGSGPCWLFHVSWCLLSLFLLCKSQTISRSSAWCHEWNQVNKIIFEGQEARQGLWVCQKWRVGSPGKSGLHISECRAAHLCTLVEPCRPLATQNLLLKMQHGCECEDVHHLQQWGQALCLGSLMWLHSTA